MCRSLELFMKIYSITLGQLSCSIPFSRINVFLSSHNLQFYISNLFLHYWFRLNWRTTKWDIHQQNRVVSIFCCCIMYSQEIPFLFCLQLRDVICCNNSCCKCNRFAYSKRPMASEVVGHFMFSTSKARYQNAYGLRTPFICNCYSLLPDSTIWRYYHPNRVRNFEKCSLGKQCHNNFHANN